MGSVAIPSGGGGGGRIPKDFSVKRYNRNGSNKQSFTCEIGDVIVVGSNTSSVHSQSIWYPNIKSGGTEIVGQQYNDNGSYIKVGLIGVATAKSFTIEWYGSGSSTGKVSVIHTDRLRNSSYTIEKGSESKSSETITNLKVGDLIVSNGCHSGNTYYGISNAVLCAALDGERYFGAVFMAIGDTAYLYQQGATSNNTHNVVAFRQR